jgi:hypothetical protein
MSTAAPPPHETPLPNPYVGPRSYTAKDPGEGRKLYGRDRELQELLQLLTVERIVLLFSPSGAGKSSLINAALLPALRKADFAVLPVMRVAHEPPDPELRKVSGFNRYVLSALMSLEEGRPVGEQRDARELVGVRLADYLKSRAASVATPAEQQRHDEDKPLALIFDQFEEILTLDPTDIEAKREFFAQAGEALRLPQHWALFSMREDYAASLDPFVRLIPTALSATYRLDLLGAAAARAAIRKPAADGGVDFTSEAAHSFVNDLRAGYVQQISGRAEQRLGPHVDPVHLQVVCYRLWEKLPVTSATRSIGEGDLKKGGDVNDALAGYYSDSVAAVVAKGLAREREIRGWVNKHLITEQGIRGQVLREEGRTQGLDNRAIDELINAHLLRAEQRRGATWIELAHDRLIEPVRADNAKYRRTLTHLQRQAEEWQTRERPEWLLLRGEELMDANKWARLHAGELTDNEVDYLKASRKRQALRVVFMVMSLGCIILLGFAVFSWVQARRANTKLGHTIAELERVSRDNLKLAELLKRQNISLAGDLAQYGADRAAPLTEEQRQQSIKANEEYQSIALASQAAGRKEIEVKYFYREGDPPKVIQTIENLGFTVVKAETVIADNIPTNFIRYGSEVNPEDVKLLAFALMRVGVQLKSIGCFDNSAGKEKQVQIGARMASVNAALIKVEDIPGLITPCQ